MKLPRPHSPFTRINLHGNTFTIYTSGKVLVLPTGDADKLPIFNEFTLSSSRLSIAESPFGGFKSTIPDYCPGTLYTPTSGMQITDTSGTNGAQTIGAGKLKELSLLTVDPENHTIENIIQIENTSTGNNPAVIDDCDSAANWIKSIATGDPSITASEGKIICIGNADLLGALRIQKYFSLDLSAYDFISVVIECNIQCTLNLVFWSGGYYVMFSGSKFTMQPGVNTFILPIKAPVNVTAGLNPVEMSGTVNWSNIEIIHVGIEGIVAGGGVEFAIHDISADVHKSAYIELQTPKKLENVALQSYTGAAYETFAVASLDDGYSNVSLDETKLEFLDGTLIKDCYGAGAGYAIFPKGVSADTVTGSAGTMQYSVNKGTSQRIGLMISLPPSDSGRTNFNKTRLKTILTYAPDSQGTYSASYDFADSTNASYGLQNIAKPWVALYDPASSEIDFFLFTHRPKNLIFKRDETGTIHEVTLYPGNGRVYHGRVTHCNPSLDSDSNLIPNCIKNDSGHFVTQDGEVFTTADNAYFDISVIDYGSIHNFLKGYGMVI